jgi:hypothetical protein
MHTTPQQDLSHIPGSSSHNIIFVYTRQQAIADGQLVDLSTNFPIDTRMFCYPLACTAAVWQLIESSAAGEEVAPDIYVWDVAYMAFNAIKKLETGSTSNNELFYHVMMPLTENGTEHKLKLVCSAGDDGSPVLTIMLPEED